MGAASWKREVVHNYRFDFIDTREFRDEGFGMRAKYTWLYVIVLKSFLVYVSDIFTAITMLTTQTWTNQIFKSCPSTQPNGCVFIPFNIGKWIFFGCIIAGFGLFAWEVRKTRQIITSRNISLAFTNVLANNYYSLRSYDHFCFFNHISSSTKKMDDFAFFIFFTFKSWKRVIISDGPRQSINALTLYSIFVSKNGPNTAPWYELSKYSDNVITTLLITSTAFTVIIFVGSLLLLIVAGVLYMPLLFHIRGNLKEYVCHKVDKRIEDIIKRRNKQRLAKAAEDAKKEARGDFSHLKDKKGNLMHAPLPQPTLPTVTIDDDEMDDDVSMRTRGPPLEPYNAGATGLYNEYSYASDYKGTSNMGQLAYGEEYPPMPGYNYEGSYDHSSATLHGDQQSDYKADHGSSHANLAHGAAPFASQDYDVSPGAYGSSLPNPYHGSALHADADRQYNHSPHPSAYERSHSTQPATTYETQQQYDAYEYQHDPSAYPGQAVYQQGGLTHQYDVSSHQQQHYYGDAGGYGGHSTGGYQ